jgi:hypothetical protein
MDPRFTSLSYPLWDFQHLPLYALSSPSIRMKRSMLYSLEKRPCDLPMFPANSLPFMAKY